MEELMKQFDGPPSLPILGNALQFLGAPKDILLHFMKLMEKYKSPFKLRLMYKQYVIIFDPEDFQTVANKILQKDCNYNFIKDMLGDGIFTSEIHKWKRNRQILNPAFNPHVLFDSFLKIFNEKNALLVQILKKELDTGKHFDLWPYIILTSVKTISGKIIETTLGKTKNFSENELQNFIEAVMKSTKVVSERFYKMWMHSSVIFNIYKYFKGYGKIFDAVHQYPLKMLYAKLQQKQETKLFVETDESLEKPLRNFIEILLDMRNKNIFTEQHIKDEIISIMFGGSETTAVTNSFLLLMLAIHQQIQDKVYNELYEVFGDSDRLPTRDDLTKLTFLEQCIKETLRRFSIVPIIIRQSDEDIQIKNYVIPKRTSIVLSILGIHLNPNIYANPFEWNPNNFDPDKVASRHKCSFVAFSTGQRGCIGQKYAWLSMKAQISTILRNYKFSTDLTMDDMQLDVDLLIRNISGYKVKLHRRTEKL
ncbi:hypothetical protein PGB90_005023 [Kerria lacca]